MFIRPESPELLSANVEPLPPERQVNAASVVPRLRVVDTDAFPHQAVLECDEIRNSLSPQPSARHPVVTVWMLPGEFDYPASIKTDFSWFVNGLALALTRERNGCGALVVQDDAVTAGRSRSRRDVRSWAATLQRVGGTVKVQGGVCTIARIDLDRASTVIAALAPVTVVVQPGDRSVVLSDAQSVVVLASVTGCDAALLQVAAAELRREHAGAKVISVAFGSQRGDSDQSFGEVTAAIDFALPSDPIGRLSARLGYLPRGRLGLAFSRLAAACCAT